MPRAIAGMPSKKPTSQFLPQQLKSDIGVLVECDPSIKAIIVKIDTEHHHDFIIEDIDDEHVLIKSNKHEDLKQLLKDVRAR